MRSLPLLASLLPLAAALSLPAPAAAQVGVTIRLGDDAYYGPVERFDGWGWGSGWPAAALVDPRPVVVLRAGGYRDAPALYLRLPAAQRRAWPSYCSRYGACSRPVYFVRDDWYRDVYVPRYRRVYRVDRDHWRDRDDWRRRHPGRGRGPGRSRGPWTW